jgi:tetratricopeptide (TPR) repeat protein/tRNA A-37 threonylcarbamoyl transferase component Bud32
MIGKTISHYRILNKLGEGGMGIVYKAEDTKLDRSVVLKFLPERLLRDEEAKKRFVREAKAASALNHPNISTIYEIGEEAEQSFISMEYVDGKSIKELLSQRTLAPDEVLEIAMQVCEGLVSAHEKGIIHRDIKSGNIMVTTRGQAKIMDFGLAKLSGQTTITKADTTMGTVAYMSPEQAQGETLDHRTDIWSLGVVLYEMLTGELPFRSEYEQAVIYSIINEDPRPVTESNPEVPESLNTIVKIALERDPAHRYQSIDQMLGDLRAVRNGFAVSKKPATQRKTRRTLFISVVALLAVIAAVVLTQHKQEPIPRKIPVGVMFFDNQTGEARYDYLRKVLADLLITDLSQSRYLQVMTFPRMFDLLKSLGQEGVEVIDAAVGFELCKLGGANVMVLGSLMKSGDTFALNTQVLDVNTKELIAPPYRVKGEGEGSILGSLVDELTDKIIKGLEISAREIELERKDIRQLTTTSLEAYRYYFAGREAAFAMYSQKAIENLEKAVALDSAFLEAYNHLARQYYITGEKEKALGVVEKAKSSSKKLPEEELVELLALEAYLRHDWDQAIAYYKKLTTIYPENIGAHGDLGTIYYQKKMMCDEGIAEFEKILELDPQGITHYSTFAYNLLGWAYFRKGKLGKADGAFKKYVALLPNQAYPLTVLGDFHLIVGNYDEAIINFQQSLKIDPDYLLTSELLGEAYLAKGMYTRALRSYRTYLAVSSTEIERAKAHFLLGKLYYLKGEYTKAAEECLQALLLNPEMIRAHWMQGLTLIKKGMSDQAETEALSIERLIEKTKDGETQTYYYHLLGELALSKNLYPQALENLGKAANIESLDRAFFANSLGQAYFRIGQLNEAVEEFQAVLEINPNYAQTHYLLGLIYEKRGEKDKARDYYQRFLEIWKDADDSLRQFVETKNRLQQL